MSYSSQWDCEGILGGSVAQTHEKVFLESSSLVLGRRQQHFTHILEVCWRQLAEWLSWHHTPIFPEPPTCVAYNFKESMSGNENNWFFHLLVLRLIKLFNLSEPQLPHL